MLLSASFHALLLMHCFEHILVHTLSTFCRSAGKRIPNDQHGLGLSRSRYIQPYFTVAGDNCASTRRLLAQLAPSFPPLFALMFALPLRSLKQGRHNTCKPPVKWQPPPHLPNLKP